MTESQASYRQIFKATSLFGGVQIVGILVGIVRSKIVAVLLGPLGIGLSGLLTSTTNIIAGFTNFGLGTSAVKDISAANSSNNEIRISTTLLIMRRLVWITGTLGALLTLVFSTLLSKLTFGNTEYKFAFIWISVTLLFNQISTGQGVLLRGTRHIGYLAKSTIIGNILGLITTIPLYYFFGMKGIVPGIIIASLTSLLMSWYFARKIQVVHVEVSWKNTFSQGKEMLKMGFIISISGIISLATSYLVKIYISNKGGVDQVGLYTAGFSIVNTYVGMIFTAMGTDYYPRLSGIAHDFIKTNRTINHQAEIALLIISPILMIFLVYINWVIILFYSTKFIGVNGMILWAAFGMLFKAASWPIGFILLAKGNSRLFFWSELLSNAILLSLNILGYKYFKLEGLGVSFLITYIIALFQVYLIARVKYSFKLDGEFYKIFILQVFLTLGCFLIVKFVPSPYKYMLGTVIILASLFHSFYELNSRIDLKSIAVKVRAKLRQGN